MRKWRDARRFGTIEVLYSVGKALVTEVVYLKSFSEEVGKTYVEVFDPMGRLVEHKLLKVGKMSQEEVEAFVVTF